MNARLATISCLAAALVLGLWLAFGRSHVGSRGSEATLDRDAASSATPVGTAEARPPAVEREAVVAEPAASAPEESTRGARGATVRFRARVVDERRFPVAAATVELLFPSSGSFRGVSDASGEVLVSVPRPAAQESGVVRATEGTRGWLEDCRLPAAGEPMNTLRPDEFDLGWLPLGPTQSIAVRVTRDGRAVAGVNVAAEARRLVALARATTDAEGRARFDALPAAWITFRARTDDADGWTGVVVPDKTLDEVEVRLEPLATLHVQARERKTGRPIAGARIGIREVCEPPRLPWGDDSSPQLPELALDVPPTDAEGRTLIAGLSAQSAYEAWATLPDDPRRHERIEQDVLPGQTEVAFDFPVRAPRTLRWPVIAGELPVPPEGTTFELRTLDAGSTLLPPPWRGRMERGELVVDDWWGIPIFWFRAPDGALARGDGALKPISFQRPRRLAITVRDADGRPAAGIALASDHATFEGVAQSVTGADGRAEFVGLFPPGEVEVTLPAFELSAGTVDLSDGDGALEYELPAARTLLVRLRLDGEARLPPRYWLWGDAVEPLRVVREHPERGEVEVEFRSFESEPLDVSVQALGFQPATRTVTLDVDSPPVVEFDLVLSCTLIVHVVSAPELRPGLALMASYDSEEAWWDQDGLETPNGAGGTYRFEGLRPGRYRVADSESGRTSEEVALDLAHPVADLSFEVVRTVHVVGRVEGPADLDPDLVRVLVEGPHVVGGEERVLKDRTFTLDVPAGEQVFLRVQHPFLTARDGPVVAASGVVLHLEKGDEVQIPLRWLRTELGRVSSIRVLRFDGDLGTKPVATLQAPVVGGVARFNGVPPGRWTFWLDPGELFTPIVLRDVEIDTGVTRLAEPALDRGSTLRLRVLARDDWPAPRVQARVVFEGRPMFRRQGQTNEGETVLELGGLPEGSYTVDLFCWVKPFRDRRTLEVDGSNDVEWTVDLR